MAFTQKQERNGATGNTSARNSAVSGPDASAVISAAIGSAMAAGAAGPPITVSEGVADFETGIAGHEMPGEA